MIYLDAEAQKRVAARIATRRRLGPLREQIETYASHGWAPSAIAERYGRSEKWAIEMVSAR